MKQILLLAFCCTIFSAFTQTNVVKIKGYAPEFIGQIVTLNEIEDYLSMHESTLASGTVQEDSTFHLIFEVKEIQKVIIRIGNNKSHFYIQPNGNYELLFPQKDKYSVYRPAGNEVEITFFDLDSTDINYHILGFNRWLDNYLALNYSDHKKNPIEFAKRMDDFKEAAQKYYAKDTGTYIFDYVRFTIANTIDNIQQQSNRNRYEKHDFYLKFQPVVYQNDAYMTYFKVFYKGMMPTIPMEVNNRVYLGLLKNSPTLIMNALGKEYTLKNARIRELVMITMMSELYYSPDYPQTNIITVLDSIKNHALFDAHKKIAGNMISRLTEANNGGKAPQFIVTKADGTKLGLEDFKGKYLYLHFFDPNSEKNRMELTILKELQKKYNKEIAFLTICKTSMVNNESMKTLNQIPWEIGTVDDLSSIYNHYKIATYPNYVLIDPYSYIVQAPALGPMPNSLYQTIDRVFFEIQKALR